MLPSSDDFDKNVTKKVLRSQRLKLSRNDPLWHNSNMLRDMLERDEAIGRQKDELYMETLEVESISTNQKASNDTITEDSQANGAAKPLRVVEDIPMVGTQPDDVLSNPESQQSGEEQYKGRLVCPKKIFMVDFSNFISLIESSFEAFAMVDRALASQISFSMYQYFCVILLWDRLIEIQSHNYSKIGIGVPFTAQRIIKQTLVPYEIAAYLEGVGNFVDHIGREHYLQLFRQLSTKVQIQDAKGTFGRVTGESHLAYETTPAPIVCLCRILADLRRTQGIMTTWDWDLPEKIRCKEQNCGRPTANLLGWGPAELLRPEHASILQSCNFNSTTNNSSVFGVKNYYNIPINEKLLNYVARVIYIAKIPKANYVGATLGSLAQAAFTKRLPLGPDDNYSRHIRVNTKNARMYNFADDIASNSYIALTFRYRMERMGEGTEKPDCLCYEWLNGAPQRWKIDADYVFNCCADLNEANFEFPECNGKRLLIEYLAKVYKMDF